MLSSTSCLASASQWSEKKQHASHSLFWDDQTQGMCRYVQSGHLPSPGPTTISQGAMLVSTCCPQLQHVVIKYWVLTDSWHDSSVCFVLFYQNNWIWELHIYVYFCSDLGWWVTPSGNGLTLRHTLLMALHGRNTCESGEAHVEREDSNRGSRGSCVRQFGYLVTVHS